MSKLFIPVGIPGCGKSTFVKNFLSGITTWSSDEIRENFFGDVNDMSNNERVFQIYHAGIDDCLRRDQDVYADATNLQPFARAKLYDIAREYSADVHIILFTNAAQAIRRNSMRSRVVPQDVMLRFVFQLEEARKDVFSEHTTSVTSIDDVQGSTWMNSSQH